MKTDDRERTAENATLSRRDFIRRSAWLGVSVSALGGLLGACSPATTPAPAPAASPTPAPAAPGPAPTATPVPAPAIKRGGTLVQAINWTVPSMDPHISSLPHHLIYENVFDGLLRLELADATTGEHKVVGVLAESWQQPDAKTTVFKLRQGVKFHDGSDFDAEVAAWNILRTRDHPKSYIRASLADIESVKALDKYSIEVKTKRDNAAILRVLAFMKGGLTRMVSKTAFEKNGEGWLERNPVGTGPFKFKEWITDDRVILERHPDYFVNGEDGKSLPYLDGLVLRYIPDPTVSLQDMKAGSNHLLQWVPPKDVDLIRRDPDLDYTELPWAGQVYFEVGFNTEAPPFDDVRVRQAALYGIDREGMHNTLGFGVGGPYYYPFWTPGSLGHQDDIPIYKYDPAKVKQLLTDAGYPNGVEVELKVIAREPENTIGEYAQQMWSAVGIKTKLVAQERLSWIDAMRAKNFQSCFWRGSLDAGVDPELSRRLISCGGGGNWAQWCDREIDGLLDQGLATLDTQKRHQIYNRVWTLIQERAYGGSGFIAPIVDAYRKGVEGIFYNFEVPNLSKTRIG